jgi:uncharacterized membrane protein
MALSSDRHRPSGSKLRHRTAKEWDALRQAFAEFLWVPALIIVAFLLLAAATFALDRSKAAWLVPMRTLLQTYVFADAGGTSDLLTTVASGIITITSITISLLLIALQQSAGALTHQVYDQFLRTWHNQAYFGVFVGLPIYALVTLASAGPLNPVFGATIALLSTILALCLLLMLFYTTVNQMRPVVIIEAIHKYVLLARKAQLGLLRATRRTPRLSAPVSLAVDARAHGFVTRIDVEALRAAAAQASAEVEVVLRVTLGAYVVFGQRLADVTAHTQADAQALAEVLEDAVHRAAKRDIATDPLDGIEELETIGWTSISSAASDPDAGVLTIYGLRDILARWSQPADDAADAGAADDVAPVVYVDDVPARLLNAFESLAVSASESMQHQSLAEILRTFELLFERLAPEGQARVEDIVLRSLSSLGDHVLTLELETALNRLIARFEAAGRSTTAAAVVAARDRLARSIGKLGSRSTRAG